MMSIYPEAADPERLSCIGKNDDYAFFGFYFYIFLDKNQSVAPAFRLNL